MTLIERDLRYLAAEEALDSALVEASNAPQPESTLVADAYSDGRLADPSTALHVIAVLLRRLKGRR